jgi:hypothetical protein
MCGSSYDGGGAGGGFIGGCSSNGFDEKCSSGGSSIVHHSRLLLLSQKFNGADQGSVKILLLKDAVDAVDAVSAALVKNHLEVVSYVHFP